MISLGPFELTQPIGRGASGVVWAGFHRAQHTPVAVKVLTADVARDPRFVDAFRTEVRVLAALDHPHVVRVLDAGVIPAGGASDVLVAGSPWLAMELASRGSVGGAQLLSWVDVRRIAASVLDGLAHAHARGVLHRDVKPANILYVGASGHRVALSDFGLASLSGVGAGAPARGGTPGFVAPEQRLGLVQQEGPWTDLYALGRTITQLVTGDPQGTDALFPVPDGFSGWLGRLVAQQPEDRFPTAAHAAFALSGLPDPPDQGPVALQIEDAPTLAWLFEGGAEPDAVAEPLPQVEAPPVPHWREVYTVDVSLPLLGVGLGLFAHRVPRLVGQADVLQQVWSVLEQALHADDPRVLVLVGLPGVGRTRVGSEVAWRLAEVGTGRVVGRAAHAVGDPGFVLVWLDDATDAVEQARSVSEPRRLVLLSSERPVDDFECVHIERLSPREHRQLIHDLLGLDPSLAARIEVRSDGNPGFALSMLGKLVDGGRLEEGPYGFSVRGELPPLPEAVARQVEAAVAGLEPSVEAALEAAALLGATFDDGVWSTVCELLDLGRTDRARAVLVERELADLEGATWRFRSPAVRELLKERATQPQRVHCACADALADLGPTWAARRGHHLVSAGLDDVAVQVLVDAAAHVDAVGADHLAALALVEEAGAALQRLQAPPSDERWGWVGLQRAIVLGYQSTALAAELMTALYEQAETWGWPNRVRVARQAARLELLVARYDRAIAWSDVALEAATEPLDIATARVTRASALGKMGRLDDASATLGEAIETYHSLGQPTYELWAVLRLIDTRRMAGDLGGAEGLLERARHLVGRVSAGASWHASVLASSGELARLRGDLDRAEGLYRDALSRMDQTGDTDRLTVRLNLAMLDLARGNPVAARDAAARLGAELRRTGPMESGVAAYGLEVAAAADLGDFSAVRRVSRHWQSALERTGTVNDDSAMLAEHAARACAAAGQVELARVTGEIAVRTWRALGRTADADRAAAVGGLVRPGPSDR